MLYQLSWTSMGMVRIGCTDRCTCLDRVIDGHRNFAERNVTIYTELELKLSMQPKGDVAPTPPSSGASCGISVVVLEATSSGGHLFKVRDLTVHVQRSPCEIHTKDANMLHFMKVRTGLKCAQQAPPYP